VGARSQATWGRRVADTPVCFPPDSNRFWPNRIVDALPDGIAFARPGIYTLTSTVTAVTTMFLLDEEHSRILGSIINQDMSFRTRLLPHGGVAFSDVRQQKQQPRTHGAHSCVMMRRGG
jgi:hypothetical protein